MKRVLALNGNESQVRSEKGINTKICKGDDLYCRLVTNFVRRLIILLRADSSVGGSF